MSPINYIKREKVANWSLGLSLLVAVSAVLFGPGIYMAIPPSTYIFLALFLAFLIPTLVLGLLGLKAEGRKKALSALIITGLASIFFFSVAVPGFRNTPLKLALVEIEFAAAPACSGQGISEAQTYAPGSGVHPVVAIVVNSSVVDMAPPVTNHWVSRDLWPASLDQVQLVVCIGPEEADTVETCEYSAGTLKKRIQFHREVRLISAQTGETIAQHTLLGSLPKQCPDFTEQGNDADIKGTKPSSTELSEWLKQVMNP